VAVIDSRLSNTASMADYWLSPWPGTEAAILLAIARLLVRERRYDRAFVEKWTNWDEYLREERTDLPVTFDAFRGATGELYGAYRVEQGAPRAADDAAAGQGVERALDAQGVSARLLRDVVPAPTFSARGPRQARDVLHARLQPRVDQPGRDVVGRDAHG